MSSVTVTVPEYGYVVSRADLGSRKAAPGVWAIDAAAYDELKRYALSTDAGDGTADPLQVMRLTTATSHHVEALQARQYAGVIVTRSGTTVEVLPKVYRPAGGALSAGDARGVLLRMLASLRDAPFKEMGSALLDHRDLPLQEVFLHMFVGEAEHVARQGWRAGYVLREANERYVRGRLCLEKDLRANPVDRSRMYTRHSFFELDRPENRLVKAALKVVEPVAPAAIRPRVTRLLEGLDAVPMPANWRDDLSRCTGGRETDYYRQLLLWAQIFLRGHSFSPFSGQTVALALMFPMDVLFESYVAQQLRRVAFREDPSCRVSLQDRGAYLFDGTERGVALRPDIVLRRGGYTRVLDTKWKLLGDVGEKPGRDDLYQMYAYGKRYAARDVTLVYPVPRRGCQAQVGRRYESVTAPAFGVHTYFVDLGEEDIAPQLRHLFYGAYAR